MMRLGLAIQRGLASLTTVGLLAGILVLTNAPVARAATHSQILGDGSSWAANAVNQWIADVSNRGLQAVYTATGSAQGRSDFARGAEDFAVSDIGYQGVDPVTGQQDSSPRPYAYLPLVAGGLSFPYQLRIAGQLVRNLRLSGETLAKIFTGQITSWNDPEITADNNGRVLPAIPIIPVVHEEGSGDNVQFSTYLDNEFPKIWRPFIGQGQTTLPPGQAFVQYWPQGEGDQIDQDGSDNVENYVNATGDNGAIGYDEYAFPLSQNQPVAKIENAAGYFTLPTQYNVAVSLTQAQVDPTSGLANLANVYSYNDPRTYPLSAYSYAIIPTSPTDSGMTTAKRQTLADYLSYAICQGQRNIGAIGYASLPYNLVQAGFAQIDRLQEADPLVDLSNDSIANCQNPTFNPGDPAVNVLDTLAPDPPVCDMAGQGPCEASSSPIGPPALGPPPLGMYVALVDGIVGDPYAATATVTGGTPPYVMALSSSSVVPPGVSFDPATGAFAGTPTEPGVYPVTITATDSASPDLLTSITLTITVTEPFIVPTATPPVGFVGTSYATTLTATGGTAPYHWALSSGSLPGGLRLDPGSGIISGIPTSTGSVTATVRVTDSDSPIPRVAGADLTITILNVAPPARKLWITPTPFPMGLVGEPYSAKVQTRGGTRPITWAIANGALPAGLELDPASGRISGRPSRPGDTRFTLTATDAGAPTHQSASYSFSIEIRPIPPRPQRPRAWWQIW